jgi:uncharacterized protein (TIGR03382 family)
MQSIRRPPVFAALLVVLAPLSARAANTYYVAPTGSDTAAGTMAAPWATIAQAQTVAVAGDTVYFRGGRYAYTSGTQPCSSGTATINAIVLNKSGTSGNLIHYWAAPGEIPIFDFSGIKDQCRIKGFDVTGSWIHLKGLEITGVPQNNMLNHESWGVWISGSNNIFEQLNTHHHMGPGLFIQAGGNNLVLNCDSHENYDSMSVNNGAPDPGGNADGFGCHIGAGDTGNVFRGCRAWWNSDDGWDFIEAVEVVTVESSWSWLNGYIPDTMTAAGNGNGFKAGGYDLVAANTPANPPHHIVQQDLAVANRASGFYVNHHPVADHFLNNTSYGNHPDFNLQGTLADGVTADNVGYLRNNLAFSGTLLSNATGPDVDESFNSWDTNLGVTVSAADFQSVSMTGLDGPRQADGSLPVIPNFHLAAGSDLIDKGTDVGLPFAGAAPDLGAFETGLPETGAGGAGGSAGTTGAGGSTGAGGTVGTTGAGGSASTTGGGGASATTGAGGGSPTGTGTTGGGGASTTGGGTGTGGKPPGVTGGGTGGCSCQTSAGGAGWLAVLLLALVAVTRRHRR